MQIIFFLKCCIVIPKIIKIIFKENTFKNYSDCSPIELALSINSLIWGNSPRLLMPK